MYLFFFFFLAGLLVDLGITCMSSMITGWKRCVARLGICASSLLCDQVKHLLLLTNRSVRLSQCAPGGCLIELCIQLSIIMLGKQLIQNNIFEIGIP